MDIYFSQRVVFGNRFPNESSEIVFVNRAEHIRRKIVDRKGVILNFPGAEGGGMEDVEPQIRFRTSIETTPSGRFYMLWEVEPDGRFWGDEGGFGMEDDEETRLYAFIDDEGRFEGKFKLYNCGTTKYIDMSKF